MSRPLNSKPHLPHGAWHASWPLLGLVAVALLCCLLYFTVAWLSGRFLFGRGHTERPIVAVLLCFSAAFVLYLGALRIALRATDDRRLRWTIGLSALAMRLILLPTTPIQEIDIYRYVWDGAVVRSGVSPFRYSPSQIVQARVGDHLPPRLARLVALRDRSPALATIVARIHYAELPTIYPPTSQAVFALAAWATPESAGVATHLIVMKTFFVAFDLATLLVLFRLLRFAGRHAGWAIAYGWCPLVLKEIANSGHLDSLAVFLTTLGLYVAATVWFASPQRHLPKPSVARLTVAALLLALAAGAKLYPVVLVPLLAASGMQRHGWRPLVVPAGVWTATVLLLLWPMLPDRSAAGSSATTSSSSAPPLPQTIEAAGPASSLQPARTAQAKDPSLGLQTFLRRFEMNDLLFLLVVENLKPQSDLAPGDRPWFGIVPEAARRWLLARLPAQAGDSDGMRALLLARLLVAGVFIGLAIGFAWQAARAANAAHWLRWCFLTLAWFWLLSPTQNPWYWLWALPLVPFARCRGWLLVSGVALAYYLRFWFIYHFPQPGVVGTTYNGMLFFDFVVVWLEFVPVLLALAVEWLWRKRFTPSPR